MLRGCHGNREEEGGRKGAHAGGDRAKPGGEGFSDSRCEGKQRTLCSACRLCQAAINPGYPATLHSQLEFAGGIVSVNSSNSSQAKHPTSTMLTLLHLLHPPPCRSQEAPIPDLDRHLSPNSGLVTKVPLSLRESLSGHPVCASANTSIFCHHWLAWPSTLQRPAFYHLHLAGAHGGHETRTGGQQRRWLQTTTVSCSYSVTDTPGTSYSHTHSPLPRLSIASGVVQDRQPSCSQRLRGPDMGPKLSARASRGEQQGEMLIRLQD